MLGFLHGMILLAGVAVAVLIKMSMDWWQKLLLGLILVLCFIIQPAQAYLGSYHYYADPSNPYVYAHPVTDVVEITKRIEEIAHAHPDGVYAHPVPDVVEITKRIEEIAQAHPDGRSMYIQVICPKDDYWPLPWYLRGFANVGWWGKVDEDVPSAPVIIASPNAEPALLKKLYELPAPGQKNLYVPLFDSYMELRPQVELRGFVTKDLWDAYQQHQSRPLLPKGDR
jgi:predicted membrane-bound mannosyltransferase